MSPPSSSHPTPSSRRPTRTRLPSSALLPLLLLATQTQSVQAAYPDPAADAYDSLLYEGDALGPSVFSCPPEARGSNTTTAARWLRFAYHDMSTHSVTNGTGGLDASIFYELDRAENKGNDLSKAEFERFANKYISKSDVIAIGAIQSIAACGGGPSAGPIIPFRRGRIDASTAGPFGVPRPEEELKDHIAIFKEQGFNSTEMVELVACGHTMGTVTDVDFPDILNPVEKDVPHKFAFDGTGDQFDNRIAKEYLDGTTQNPLVVTNNVTMRSDARIFGSDKNETIKRLASSADVFKSTCATLFERMLNTVPKGVTLSPPMYPMKIKVNSNTVQLAVVPGNATMMLLTVNIRFPGFIPERLVTAFCSHSPSSNASLPACPKTAFTNFSNIDLPLLRAFGQDTALLYNFIQIPIDASASVGTFWFEVDELDGKGPFLVDNDGKGFPVGQDVVLYSSARVDVPQKSPVVKDLGQKRRFEIIAAVRSSAASDPSLKVYADVLWRGRDLTRRVDLAEAVDLNKGGQGPYKFYKAEFVEGIDFNPSFDLVAEVGGKVWRQDNRQFE